MDYDTLVDILFVALPWVWIAAATVLLVTWTRSAKRPQLVRLLAVVLAGWGMTDFFVSPRAWPAAWVLIAKGVCLVAVAGVLIAAVTGAGAPKKPEPPGDPGRSG